MAKFVKASRKYQMVSHPALIIKLFLSQEQKYFLNIPIFLMTAAFPKIL